MHEYKTTTGLETPQQEDPAYVAAMVAKAEGTPVVEPQAPPVEADNKLFAGKYKSIEELEKGYAELQKKLGQPKVSDTTETPAKETPLEALKVNETETEENAEQVLEQQGLNIETFTQEFQEKGELSESSYEQLKKAGIPQDMVDAYIEGIQLKASIAQTRVFDTVGGQDEYNKLLTWATNNVSAQERIAYNSVLETGDMDKILLAVKGLKASYEDAYGKQPKLITPTETATTTHQGFESKAQLKSAMSDPRYAKDPAYRREVELKLSRSSLF